MCQCIQTDNLQFFSNILQPDVLVTHQRGVHAWSESSHFGWDPAVGGHFLQELIKAAPTPAGWPTLTDMKVIDGAPYQPLTTPKLFRRPDALNSHSLLVLSPTYLLHRWLQPQTKNKILIFKKTDPGELSDPQLHTLSPTLCAARSWLSAGSGLAPVKLSSLMC